MKLLMGGTSSTLKGGFSGLKGRLMVTLISLT